MAHESLVLRYAQQLRVFDKHQIVEAMGENCPWAEGPSRPNNIYKACLNLEKEGTLEKCDGGFRVKGCKAELTAHSKELTDCIAQLLKLPYEVHTQREVMTPIGTRTDCIALIVKGTKARCCVLEVCLTETVDYLNSKINAWLYWHKAGEFLSNLLKAKIPHFDIVVFGKQHPKAISFNHYLEEVKNG